MLRISVNKEDTVETWELEGKLSGDWVKELERCWKQSAPQAGVTVQVNLKAVSYIDAAGRKLLADMHESGMEVKGCGCMARAVVEEIIREARTGGARITPKKILGVVMFGILMLGGSARLFAHGNSVPRPSAQILDMSTANR